MKKIIAALLAALMLCTCFACAEESAFTFRNGLHWGMTPDEVLAVEGRTEYWDFDELSYTASITELEDLMVSKFEADIVYFFVEGKLACVEIDPALWHEYDAEDIEYLKQALSIVYGEADPNLPVPATVAALMEMSDYTVVCGWQPTEDTYIGIMSNGNYIELGYFNVNVDFVAEMMSVAPTPTPEPINTNGL
ncbi:MAG: hypothetical protein IKL25_05895 [Clostridia bacterium]|nr:hypothetical protein [Clostridia bacterium]